MSEMEQTQTLPTLPITHGVLFPYLMTPLAIVRPISLAAVEAALAGESKELAVVAQRDASVEAPVQGALYGIGAKAVVQKVAHLQDGTLEIIALGVERVKLLNLEQTEPYLTSRVMVLPAPEDKSAEVEAAHRIVLELAGRALTFVEPEVQLLLGQLLTSVTDPLRIV